MRSPDGFEGAIETDERSYREMRPVRIGILGGFRVSIGSRTIGEDQWRLRKAAALIKLLALAPNHRLHCEQLMHLLWPRLEPKAAANNLRRVLHCARRTVEPDLKSAARYLGRQAGQVVLCPEAPLWVDVDAFEEAAATACRTREPEAYWAALDTYSGELLPADRYEEWTEIRREQLRETYLALLTEVAALHEERGEGGPKIEAVRRMSLEMPVHRRSHAKISNTFSSSPDELSRGLTRRQREVVILVSRGMTNRRIAEKLGVSERTVDAHVRKVFAKLGLRSRVQLATWASERRFLLQDKS